LLTRGQWGKGIEENDRFPVIIHGIPQGPRRVGLREQIETLTSFTESLRDRTADAIDRLEKALGGKTEEKSPEEEPPKSKRPRAKRG
jgi:hypothetical protein